MGNSSPVEYTLFVHQGYVLVVYGKMCTPRVKFYLSIFLLVGGEVRHGGRGGGGIENVKDAVWRGEGRAWSRRGGGGWYGESLHHGSVGAFGRK
jgi:hypothetical protein